MSTGTTIALFTISGLSLITSATTLAVIIFGAKRVETEMEEVKTKSNDALRKVKAAINAIEI